MAKELFHVYTPDGKERLISVRAERHAIRSAIHTAWVDKFRYKNDKGWKKSRPCPLHECRIIEDASGAAHKISEEL